VTRLCHPEARSALRADDKRAGIGYMVLGITSLPLP
jgi:hypothetical protein